MFTNNHVCELLLTAYINIKDDKKNNDSYGSRYPVYNDNICYCVLFYQLKSRFPLQKG